MASEIVPQVVEKGLVYDLTPFGMPAVALYYLDQFGSSTELPEDKRPIGIHYSPKNPASQYVGAFEVTPTEIRGRDQLLPRVSNFQVLVRREATLGAFGGTGLSKEWHVNGNGDADLIYMHKTEGEQIDGSNQYDIRFVKAIGNIMQRQFHNPCLPYKLEQRLGQMLSQVSQPDILSERTIKLNLAQIEGQITAAFFLRDWDTNESARLYEASLPVTRMTVTSDNIMLGELTTPRIEFDNDMNQADFQLRGYGYRNLRQLVER